MTGGRIAVLGPTGRNFAAGMSGGVAESWGPHDQFDTQCNMEMVELDRVESAEDRAELETMIRNHQAYTGSTVAGALLDNWERSLQQFIKVMPTDYKRVLEERKQMSAG